MTPTKEQSLDIERAMGFEIPWYRIEEIIIRWEKIRNSPKQGKEKKMSTDKKECQKSTWQVRMQTEYKEVKARYNKLHSTIVKIEAGTCDFKPACSLELLKRQAKAMVEYLYILELRAEVEKVALD